VNAVLRGEVKLRGGIASYTLHRRVGGGVREIAERLNFVLCRAIFLFL